MAKLQEAHVFGGVQQDISVSKYPAQFIYSGLNIRLTAREGDTLLSISNERGTKDTNVEITGNYIGHCQLNKYLVVFSTTSTTREKDGSTTGNDYITRIDLGSLGATVLYTGNIGLCVLNPVDAIASYESEIIQKIYWTDGFNQPRMINIAPSNDSKIGEYTSNSFDFIPDLTLQESISIQKVFGASGEFPPGMIQYAFTYYNKYGHETNIFYTTKLYAVAYRDRGASPEDKVDVSFKITVEKLDKNFDYLRIYSIQRTSINATPICKRIQDIKISEAQKDADDNYWTVYTDTGVNGNSIDPTELLYKGGETILAQTLEQKDNTLFLGNISIKRSPVPTTVKDEISEIFDSKSVDVNTDTDTDKAKMSSGYKEFQGELISVGDFPYTNSIDYSGFKRGEVYRFGIQFQHKSGKWSEPVWLRDYRITSSGVSGTSPTIYPPYLNNENGKLFLPQVNVTISDAEIIEVLNGADYKKARLLMAQPSNTDRTILCQGIANPVVYTKEKRQGINKDGIPYESGDKGSLYAQSSWIFRPLWVRGEDTYDTTAEDGGGYITGMQDTFKYISDISNLEGVYDSKTQKNYSSPELRSTEIGASLKYNSFRVDEEMITIHTPELIFDEALYSEDWSTVGVRRIGNTMFDRDFGDIDIQTKTPTIGSAAGFIHKPIKTKGNAALISGLFYEDYIVDDYDDNDPKYRRYKDNTHVPVDWPVFMWHHSGSLNNDVNREARSAELLKKKISNYHISDSNIIYASPDIKETKDVKLFNSEEVQVIKVDGKTYMGNIDTSLVPKAPQRKYFVGDPWRTKKDTTFNSLVTWMLGLKDPGDENSRNGFWKQTLGEGPLGITWTNYGDEWTHLGDIVPAVCETSEPIRMKYKSTPHLVAKLDTTSSVFSLTSALPLLEIIKSYNKDTFYGGQSEDALKANIWLPISIPVSIPQSGPLTITSDRGDTWYQRFDCLKTYAFTPEDENQVIDIASFMVETHLNIDGRYDRNRGQSSNLNMSPRNYNLYNPVYSQADNFFTYRIMDSDYYDNRDFPNQITWTKEKIGGADVDLWTNITLASTYDMDGSKGKVISLNTWKNQIYCFQNKGVSNILFNSRVQIPVSDGVPIEISNNYKVDGYNYISDGIGCNNKWFIKESSSGIYFIDSIGSHLLHIGEGLQDLSEKCNMTRWFKENNASIKKIVLDDTNHDVYIVQKNDGKALCFSEKLGQFTGEYDYGNTDLVETYDGHVFTMKDRSLWKMFEGDYCKFFGIPKAWGFTFISNGSSTNATSLDKIFTNLEFRASILGDGVLGEKEKFTPTLPFDSLETWNEYQHGITTLENKDGHSAMIHGTDNSSLKRKFRIWRCDIPRNNAPLTADDNLPNLSRKIRKPLDRMRNPWLYIKLQKEAHDSMPMTEIHDIIVTYFG